MTELYDWLTIWDRHVSTEDRKRPPEETKSSSPIRRRRKMVLNKEYNNPIAFSSASEPNTSCE
jgi:hypothetical protein